MSDDERNSEAQESDALTEEDLDTLTGDELDDDLDTLTGDELDDDLDTLTGDELDDDLDTLTGDELDDDLDTLTGDELDDDLDTLTGDELSDDPDTLTGDELDDDPDSPQEKPRAAGASAAVAEDRKRMGLLAWVAAATAMLLFFVICGGVVFQKWRQRISSSGKPVASVVVTVAVPGKIRMVLKDFLIPLQPAHEYTCFSFALVIQSRDSGLVRRINHEKSWLRAVVYDTLIKRVQGTTKTPSLEMFRQWVDQAVQHALSPVFLESVDIQQFLFV